MGLVDDYLLFELSNHRRKGDLAYACSRQAIMRRTWAPSRLPPQFPCTARA